VWTQDTQYEYQTRVELQAPPPAYVQEVIDDIDAEYLMECQLAGLPLKNHDFIFDDQIRAHNWIQPTDEGKVYTCIKRYKGQRVATLYMTYVTLIEYIGEYGFEYLEDGVLYKPYKGVLRDLEVEILKPNKTLLEGLSAALFDPMGLDLNGDGMVAIDDLDTLLHFVDYYRLTYHAPLSEDHFFSTPARRVCEITRQLTAYERELINA